MQPRESTAKLGTVTFFRLGNEALRMPIHTYPVSVAKLVFGPSPARGGQRIAWGELSEPLVRIGKRKALKGRQKALLYKAFCPLRDSIITEHPTPAERSGPGAILCPPLQGLA